MKNLLIVSVISCLLFCGCKGEKKQEEKKYKSLDEAFANSVVANPERLNYFEISLLDSKDKVFLKLSSDSVKFTKDDLIIIPASNAYRSLTTKEFAEHKKNTDPEVIHVDESDSFFIVNRSTVWTYWGEHLEVPCHFFGPEVIGPGTVTTGNQDIPTDTVSISESSEPVKGQQKTLVFYKCITTVTGFTICENKCDDPTDITCTFHLTTGEVYSVPRPHRDADNKSYCNCHDLNCD